MTIRELTEKDIPAFYHMMCLLDEETEYMMYEPGERRDPEGFRTRVLEALSGGDFLLAAESENGELVGFLWAERGKMNRIRHTAYIVAGIRESYRRRGIGTAFFRQLDEWAAASGIVRLELTVECPNENAKALYEKNGFRVEGIRPKAMKVNGSLIDEYYMGKIIGEPSE